ncbi:MAG: SRPBCC family protein [Pseudothermotoga sp.]
MIEIPKMEFIEYFDAPLQRVWEVFVNTEGWDPWFTDGMKMETKEGGRIFFRWTRLTQGETVEDRGITVILEPYKIWEFWWYEYEDGFRSHVTMTFQANKDKGTWVKVQDKVLVTQINDLPIAFGCAFGWGQMFCLAKAYIENGLILI